MSISSKSLWSSMAATSQRYSAVSDRVVLKIRMLAGSLSWALCSKSPFWEEKTCYNGSLKYTTWLHSSKQKSQPTSFKVLFIQLRLEKLMHGFKKSNISFQFTSYLVLKVDVTWDTIFNLFPFNSWVVGWNRLYQAGQFNGCEGKQNAWKQAQASQMSKRKATLALTYAQTHLPIQSCPWFGGLHREMMECDLRKRRQNAD